MLITKQTLHIDKQLKSSMNPFLSNIRNICLFYAIWLVTGCFLATILVLTNAGMWSNALFFSIPSMLVFGVLSSSAYYVSRALPMRKRRFLQVFGIFGGAAIFHSGLWVLLCYIWNNLSWQFNETWAGIKFGQQVPALLLISGTLLFLLSILIYDVVIALENVRSAERQEATSKVLAREADLQVLRSQINPHFLFNSLNSISALTTIDPAGARNMTIELAQFFRQTLALSEKQKITLTKEIALCNHFLSIEKIRFGKKLQVQMTIDPESEPCLVPPMLLQPLLENAIKHGIRDMIDGGTILVSTKVQEGWLHIVVENPVDLQSNSGTQGTGTGLNNLRDRMRSLYAEKSRVIWGKNDAIFRIEITFPLELSPN